uniref:Uncharacterized protein n=1 Tax=Myotis myotis TaxID=51298 RepID=A0A7J7T6M8_MYOMY|nr:hypothetical protein mMyoMyo1_009241 [Myotis myotis]
MTVGEVLPRVRTGGLSCACAAAKAARRSNRRPAAAAVLERNQPDRHLLSKLPRWGGWPGGGRRCGRSPGCLVASAQPGDEPCAVGTGGGGARLGGCQLCCPGGRAPLAPQPLASDRSPAPAATCLRAGAGEGGGWRGLQCVGTARATCCTCCLGATPRSGWMCSSVSSASRTAESRACLAGTCCGLVL